MNTVLRDPVLIAVQQVDLRMGCKKVLDQHFRAFIQTAVVVTCNDDIRHLAVFSQQMVLEMGIRDHLCGERFSRCMILRSDLFHQFFFVDQIPVIVGSYCHVPCTPLCARRNVCAAAGFRPDAGLLLPYLH